MKVNPQLELETNFNDKYFAKLDLINKLKSDSPQYLRRRQELVNMVRAHVKTAYQIGLNTGRKIK